TFVLDYKAKKETLKSCGKMWRDFKSRITTELIYEYRHTCPELLEHPPASYAQWIEPQVWDEFVKKRLSAEWEEVRKVQQGMATQNKYPHCMSCLGYARLEAKIEKDEGRCGIDRSKLWNRGRVSKKGGHTEKIKAVVDRIVSCLL
ncbi:hypothetical protein PanWU01x14_297420, partial [Parasponia andersonii]